MVAKFGINATEIGPTQNTITPKQGVKDMSLATLVSGLGAGAIQGTETLVTREASKFGQMYEEITRMGLGGEAVTPEEKAFKEQMDVFQQVTQMGRPNVAKVYREAFLRKSIADKPWMAKRYEAMSGRVDSRWTDLMSAMQESEAAARNAAAAEQASAEKLMKEQRTRISALGEEIGYNPGKPWTSMSPQELNYHEMRLHAANNTRNLIKAHRDDVAFENTQSAERRAQNKEARAGFNFSQERRALSARGIADSVTNEAMMSVTRAMQEYLTRPSEPSQAPMTNEQLAAEGVRLSTEAGNALRANLININATENLGLSPTDIDQRVAQLQAGIETYSALVTGPTAPAQVSARELERLETMAGITGHTTFPVLAAMNKIGIKHDLASTPALVTALGMERGSQNQVALATSMANLISQIGDGSSFKPDQTPANRALQLYSTNMLVQAYKSGSGAYLAMVKNPSAWGLFIAPAANTIEVAPYNQKLEILEAVSNPILLNEIDKMPANIKDPAYEAIESSLRNITSFFGEERSFARKITGFNLATKEFEIPAEDTASQRELRDLNSVLQRALFVEEKFRGEVDPYSVIRKYFGGKVADKLQPAEEETPQ